METILEYRGKGFAMDVCAGLIDYCLENGLEPAWSCKYENTGSYKLVKKIGFEPSALMLYYCLSN